MNRSIKNLTLAAMFLALGLVLPFLSGQIPQIGSKLLPMHIPVFLVRPDLRLEIRRSGRLHPAAASFSDLRDARLFPGRYGHGL